MIEVLSYHMVHLRCVWLFVHSKHALTSEGHIPVQKPAIRARALVEIAHYLNWMRDIG